jgi:hypothetical protein
MFRNAPNAGVKIRHQLAAAFGFHNAGAGSAVTLSSTRADGGA